MAEHYAPTPSELGQHVVEGVEVASVVRWQRQLRRKRGGGMCAYAVFSMMGFYPVTPGLPEYQLGSPVFTRVTMHLPNGRDFIVDAPKSSRDVKYVASATLGGKPLDGTSIPHSFLVAGEKLSLDMTDRPPRERAVVLGDAHVERFAGQTVRRLHRDVLHCHFLCEIPCVAHGIKICYTTGIYLYAYGMAMVG